MKTTVEGILPVLKLLKYAGVFPYKIIYQDSGSVLHVDTPRVFQNLGLETSWMYGLYLSTVGIYVTLRVLIGSTQLFHYLLFVSEHKFPYGFNSVCTSLLFLFAIVVRIRSNGQSRQVIDLLNSWHQVESEVERLMSLKSQPWSVNKGKLSLIPFKAPTRTRRTSHLNCTMSILSKSPYPAIKMNLFLTLLNIIAFWGSIFNNPRYVMYIYSLVDRNVEIPWLRLVSTLEVNYFIVIIWIHFLQFDGLVIAFSMSIKNCLRVCRPSWKVEKTRPCSIQGPEIWLKVYTKLGSLVTRFNVIYSYYFLALKFCYLICLCILFHLPIRHIEMLQYFLVSFIMIAVTILSRVSRVLTAMGNVEREATMFKESWTCKLGEGNQNLVISNRTWKAIIAAPKIAFRAGPFYDINSSTILTFFSIATTYIIVVLQIGN